MIKFLLRAYNDEKLSEKEMETLLDVLNRLGFSDILTEEHDEDNN